MQKLLALVAACLISGAMAFGHANVRDQAPTSGGTLKANSASTSLDGGGIAPATSLTAQSTPSTRNQALPGNANPAKAASSDARANGKAVRPESAKSGTPGTAAGNTPSNGDNSSNNGTTDDSGNNPTSGRGANTIKNPGLGAGAQWFWIALGVIIGVILIGVLVSRNRIRSDIDDTDPALRVSQNRQDQNADRGDDQIRRAS